MDLQILLRRPEMRSWALRESRRRLGVRRGGDYCDTVLLSYPRRDHLGAPQVRSSAAMVRRVTLTIGPRPERWHAFSRPVRARVGALVRLSVPGRSARPD